MAFSHRPKPDHSAASPAAAPRYDQDLYAWAREQVELLRARRLNEIDAENIAEEISDVGSEQYDKLESALRVLLTHMLKWDYQSQRRSASWENTIAIQRNHTRRQLRKNPSLKSRVEEAVADAYSDARLIASTETALDPGRFPEECPYNWDDILSRPFQR
jgi:hypothetical protein